ncbi:hypothetical protein [Muricoccus radiodurans]|uniref:hypothetical protein n=1 Tax=Muricoccus radiodurans TaxID=2231721 RepID=UPI003CF91771
MPETRFVALVIVSVGALLALARLVRLPPSVTLFAGGLLSVLLPGPLPPLRVDPLIVLGMILPPLLYAGVTDLSPAVLRWAAWRGVLAGALWSLGLTAACAFAASLLLPGLDPVACMAIGVAAAIAEPRLLTETGLSRHLPRTLSDGLSAQLATAPLIGVSLSLLVAKSVGGPAPGLQTIAWTLARDASLGAAAGVALGLAMAALRRRLDHPPTEAALSVATPFAAAAIGEGMGISPIAVLIAAGLTIAARHTDPATGESLASPETRLLLRDLWRALNEVLTGALFFLMGRALPEALQSPLPWMTLAVAAAALLALCWAVQFGISWAALAMPSAPATPREGGGRVPAWQAAILLAASAGRSVIALAVALALPAAAGGAPYAARDAVIAVTAVLVIASALIQWPLLPRLLAWARPDGAAEADREAALAAEATAAIPADRPEDGHRRLRALRETDSIGDAALHDGEAALALRARAAEVSGQVPKRH